MVKMKCASANPTFLGLRGEGGGVDGFLDEIPQKLFREYIFYATDVGGT